MEIPTGHQAVMPYLMLADSAKFIDFTQKVFGAEVTFKRMREDEKTIMHSEINVNGSTIMFCDATDKFREQTCNFFVYVESADNSYEKALQCEGKSVMELSDQDYGRTCGVIDPSGNTWWITSVSDK
ncbi:VOC family protein [Pedobacter sp. HMF7647]|uniref:VOC family protein n=1 Tax=Hufsiella arboris TaxID=2695275 RepID=A0A7K1YCS2_9SPHI|nr:VOC family protein [Hufsiella arboris]MXV52375.1 VOC family protein [Hufsiella arboris]